MTTYRYVPVMHWKQGEQAGLEQLSVKGKAGVTPLIILLDAQYKTPKPPKNPKKPSKTAAEKFTSQVDEAWGKSDAFLDASDLVGTASKHPLDDIAAAARSSGLALIPAVSVAASPDYAAAVKRMVAKDGRGVALRVSVNEMVGATTWFGAWPYPVSETDLIVDLRGGVAQAATMGALLVQGFAKLHKANSWRSVTIAGGCLPQNLQALARGPSLMTRDELILWRAIAPNVSYQLDFGDYGSIWPGQQPSIPAPPPANAKYTLKDHFLVYRGVKTSGAGGIPMDRQFRSHARAIGAYLPRGRLSHCWADDQIDGYAASATGTKCGNPTTWIGLNVNRHIEVTRHHLP